MICYGIIIEPTTLILICFRSMIVRYLWTTWAWVSPTEGRWLFCRRLLEDLLLTPKIVMGFNPLNRSAAISHLTKASIISLLHSWRYSLSLARWQGARTSRCTRDLHTAYKTSSGFVEIWDTILRFSFFWTKRGIKRSFYGLIPTITSRLNPWSQQRGPLTSALNKKTKNKQRKCDCFR